MAHRGNENSVLSRVVGHAEREVLVAPSQLHDGHVLGRREVQLAQVAVLDVVEQVVVGGVGRPLPLQLENDHPAVMTWLEEIKQQKKHDYLSQVFFFLLDIHILLSLVSSVHFDPVA